MKHVIDNSEDHLERNPFPELHRPPSAISDSNPNPKDGSNSDGKSPRIPKNPDNDKSDIGLYRASEAVTEKEVEHGLAEKVPDHDGTADRSKGSGEVRMIRVARSSRSSSSS